MLMSRWLFPAVLHCGHIHIHGVQKMFFVQLIQNWNGLNVTESFCRTSPQMNEKLLFWAQNVYVYVTAVLRWWMHTMVYFLWVSIRAKATGHVKKKSGNVICVYFYLEFALVLVEGLCETCRVNVLMSYLSPLSKFGERAFSVAGPAARNNLPIDNQQHFCF